MPRILLGWELGANRGHIQRLSAIAHRLRGDGHAVAVALQRIDSANPDDLPDGVDIWQAPLWPRLLVNVARSGGVSPATMGDILYRLGLDRAATLGALVRGWDSILAAFRPDAVIADFAPALLAAARGRVLSIAVGNGFDLAPPELECFPSLSGSPAAHDEAATLDYANAGLTAAGREPLEHLPAIFSADVTLASTFVEVDPYARWRTTPQVAPAVRLPLPPQVDGSGEEVFVYGAETMRPDAALWKGLAASGLPVRVHIPYAPPALAGGIRALGLAFETAPLPFAEIARRSRVVISHGGHGFVSSALIAGLPQVVTWFDLEKRGQGEALVRARLGGTVPFASIRPEPFAASLRALYENEELAGRARAAAPSFRARCTPSFEDEVVAAVNRLTRS